MINAAELRLCNIVQSVTGVWLYVISISPGSIMYDRYDMNAVAGTCSIEDIKPIPITYETLLAFGFKYDPPGSTILIHQSILLHEFDDNKFCLEQYTGHRIEIKSLHQLQNLYFVITGTELKVDAYDPLPTNNPH